MRDVMKRTKQGGGDVTHTMYRTMPDGTIATISNTLKRRVQTLARHEGEKGVVFSSCPCPECCLGTGRVYAYPTPTAAQTLVRASDRAVKAKGRQQHKRPQTVLRRRTQEG